MRTVLCLAVLAASSHLAAQDFGRVNAPPPEFLELKSQFDDPASGWTRLFNGKDLTGWGPMDYGRRPGRPADWRFPVLAALDPGDDHRLALEPFDGKRPGTQPSIATNQEGRSANLVSSAVFGDVELYVEFIVPRRSNAGVCLQGNYEVQIYDSHGKPAGELEYRDNGGIYGFPGRFGRVGGAPPRVNVSRKPGEWQSFHIWFQAPRFGPDGKKIENARFLRILHNGVEIHGHHELIQSTRGQAPWAEKPEAPLLLQCDHGPVAYRNLYVRPLSAGL